MKKEMLKLDLRKGFDKNFITESIKLSESLLNSIPISNHDLVITEATNRNYDINIKTTNDFILEQIENMLNKSYEYFNGRKIESFREILTFEVELFKINNIKNYHYEISFSIWNKQQNLSTGTGFANIDVCLADLDDLLNTFNNELSKFKLNKTQINKIFEIYEETSPLFQKITNIDEWLMQDFENSIGTSIDVLLNDYEEEPFIFNKESIYKLLKNGEEDTVKLFLDNINICEIKEEEVTAIDIYLFDKSNKITLKKNEYIKAEIIKEDDVKEKYALANII